MAQGRNYLTKKAGHVHNGKAHPGKKNKKQYSHKLSSAKFTKKGNPTTEIRRGCSGMKHHGGQEVTGMINRNIEEIMASRVLQSGTTLSMQDVHTAGKARLKEINQAARTKKKSRVAQKLHALEQAIQAQEDGDERIKRPTANAVRNL